MRDKRSPWIVSHALSPLFYLTIHKNIMSAGDQVMPFPRLATQKCKASDNRPRKPFHNPFPISMMTLVHGQHHRYRTHDQNKCHQTHEGKREVGLASTRKCIEYKTWARPVILAKTYCTIRDQECTESKGVTHQKIPHHQFAIFNIERAFAPAPPFRLMLTNCRRCHL